MAVPPPQRMSLDAFLEWEGEPDVRYELHDGVPIAIPPTDLAHQAMVGELAWRCGQSLGGRPNWCS